MKADQSYLQWVLARRPAAEIAEGDLELVSFTPQPLEVGEVRVRNVYLSLDPTQRLWMSDRETYLPPVEVGSVMRGGTVGVVTESRSERYAPGDVVAVGLGGWATVSTVSDRLVFPITRVPGVPLSASMSVLGSTGRTAYFGITKVGQVQAGETVVITAAAGAVGSVAGQIAKLAGARVIGIAGGSEKCRWLTDELGFDGSIDYRSEDVGEALDRLCPEGIDVDFENVGGDMMEAIYVRMRQHGRIAVCGQIAAYNDEGAVPGPRDFSLVLMRRLRIQGFLVMDFPREEANEALGQWVSSGLLKWRDHIVPGLENAVSALDLLFAGKNQGKLMVQISDEPPEVGL